ncbi:conserved hypothetical protein [Leishmania major strain Friedlin]|uniref:YqgE/AlgH family protein n=1 Tax=Leishmania major TaxID=5664 RepID=Q4QG99_LEIMA|nr:conserved hypothetical protein [Leishmania major strain Friedlin]CAG9570961.1 Uncharacterized_ACR_-_COG1678_-_putative [Leishmania major strain Friedlin]CAJ02599.1 conserved hypothetical protein [Leishmania major strain Friedlin]|eukprot:XP_001681799.1 conserved hypothetical protein [Leishmania major strain Friedlin]
MEKVVLTTYRKLYKMCRRVDASVAMRTQLMCCPLQVYDHRMMEWQPFDISEMKWAESRTFLDALIRRLNNGSPQYIPPLPQETTRAVEAYKEQCASMFTVAKGNADGAAASDEGAPATTSAAEEAAGTEAAAASGSSTASLGGARGTTVPLCVLPYSALTVALRQIYEATPFSMSNVTNAFAAVKELQYVCDLDNAGKTKLVTMTAGSSSTSSAEAADVVRLQRALEVMPLHNLLIHGLSSDQRVSLDRQTRRARKCSSASRDNDGPPVTIEAAAAAAASRAAMTPEAAAPTSAENVFDGAPDVEGEADLTGEGEGGGVAEESERTERRSPPEGSRVPSVEELSDNLPAQAELAKEPKEVQLLISHPTARGFFRRTVLLMVRHVTHESAALVLNKPLRNEEGLEMSIEATVRLGRVHPIFRRHLAQHTLMIGGPVMSGSSFDDSIFLLHRVPGVPHALPLGSNLWLDGDLDVLMAKLDAEEASAEEDIVVLCGFAGWGFDQLKGELGHGYWVVASGPSADASVGAFVMSLARTTRDQSQHQQKQQAPNTGAAAASSSENEKEPTEVAGAASAGAESGSAEQEQAAAPAFEGTGKPEEILRAEAQHAADAAASPTLRFLKRRRRRAADFGKVRSGHIETLSWVRAYASVGQPYADMAINQKAFAEDDDFQE